MLRQRFGNSPPGSLKAGEVLCAAGGASDGIYHLRAGWAYRFRNLSNGRRAVVDVYLPGDVIGLGTVLGARAAEEISALTSVTVEGIPAEEALMELMAERPTALYLAWLLSQHQRRAERRLAAVSGLDAHGRLAMMLLDFHTRLQRRRLITGATYHLPLTQSQIGQYLGLTVVHINRIFKSLRAQRVVDLEKHCMTILDVQRLTSLAQYGEIVSLFGASVGGRSLTEIALSPGKAAE